MKLESTEVRKVVWLDAWTEPGWRYPYSKKPGPLEVTSIGFLVFDTADSVTLAGTVYCDDEDSRVNNMITIPKVCIKSNQKVKWDVE